MKAIDIRYNKDIIGDKASSNIKARIQKLANKEDVKSIKSILARNGHPQDLNEERFEGGRGSCPSLSCEKCWEQVIKDE